MRAVRPPVPRLQQRGVGLIEGLISLVILSFGVLGLARFQIGMLKQTTDAQNRVAAVTLSEELLSYVRVDVLNAPCYTVPQVGSCGSDVAKSLAAAWQQKVAAQGFSAAVASMPSSTQFHTVLNWTSHAFGDVRTVEATTDVRP